MSTKRKQIYIPRRSYLARAGSYLPVPATDKEPPRITINALSPSGEFFRTCPSRRPSPLCRRSPSRPRANNARDEQVNASYLTEATRPDPTRRLRAFLETPTGCLCTVARYSAVLERDGSSIFHILFLPNSMIATANRGFGNCGVILSYRC